MAKFNFNEHPYYDDYVPSNRFYKILFKPSLPLQNRELNQSQIMVELIEILDKRKDGPLF